MPWILALSLLISSAEKFSSEPCGEADLECVIRSLQAHAIEVESLGRQLAISKSQFANSEELIKVWREQASIANDAAKEAMKALKPMAWYQAPVLWVAVGVTIGAVLAIVMVYAVRPVFQ